MRHTTLIAGISITLLAVACGGAKQGEAHAPPSGSGDQQPGAAQGYYAGGDVGGAADAPAPAAPPDDSADFDGAGEEAEAPAATAAPRRDRARRIERERPGLATQWGETRESRITTAPFFREDPSSPAALARVFYNNRAGARAMASRRGFVDLDSAEFSVAGGALTVSLRDASGRPLDAFRTRGKNFAVGESGQRYIIHIRNHTGARLEAVATVDGLDVMDGRDGSFSKRGYILSPFSSIEIDGFRQSFDTVAAFRFGSVRSSYAASKGKARNVGVIGVAFFQERGEPWPWHGGELDRRESADPFPARFARPPRRR